MFGTTRTVQPGLSAGAPAGRPKAAVSGGVIDSWPSQNGQCSASPTRVVRPVAPGRDARPGTTSTVSPVSGLRAQVERYSFGSSITVFGRNGCSRSIGTGKMVVLLLVPAISVSVCR